jgi:hypothetical protein
MGNANCDPASRGEAHNQVTLQKGPVLVDIIWDWDGTSVYPNCDGPVRSLHTTNTSSSTVWAVLPNKKKAPQWVQIDPGTDVTTTAAGQLSNLGLSNYSDVAGVGISYTQPA